MRRPRSPAPVVLSLALLVPLACGVPSLPRPPLGPHLPDDFSSVAIPPPSPRPQAVPARSAAAVWVDGEWVAAGDNAWSWQPGGWVQPPPGARLALWSLEWLPDGRLRYAPSVFHLPDGSTLSLASLLGFSQGPGRQPPCPPSSPPFASLDAFVPLSSAPPFASLAPLPSLSVSMPPLPPPDPFPTPSSSSPRPPPSASSSAPPTPRP